MGIFNNWILIVESNGDCRSNFGYYIVMNNELAPPTSLNRSMIARSLQNVDNAECARICTTNAEPTLSHCSAFNYWSAIRKCELFAMTVEPHGTALLVESDKGAVYGEKFCIPGQRKLDTGLLCLTKNLVQSILRSIRQDLKHAWKFRIIGRAGCLYWFRFKIGEILMLALSFSRK